jgi:DNA-3-methyladenine glycosylase
MPLKPLGGVVPFGLCQHSLHQYRATGKMANVPASKIEEVDALRQVLSEDIELASRALLGCLLIRGEMVAQIVETEAYTWDDPGCHAYKKEKMKNMALYGEPGTSYVYFTYGSHWMLNVVGDPVGVPGAVLIRAAKPISGLDEFRHNRPGITRDRDLLSGPGRLAKAFDIDNRLNAVDLLDGSAPLRIETQDYRPIVGVTPRIGLAAGKGENLLRRFIDVNLIEWSTKHKLNQTILGDIQSD